MAEPTQAQINAALLTYESRILEAAEALKRPVSYREQYAAMRAALIAAMDEGLKL